MDSLACIEGRGSIGVCRDALHCPNAAANLIPVDLINTCGTTITFGMHHVIAKSVKFPDRATEEKLRGFGIEIYLWWIIKSKMFDLLFRSGFAVREVEVFKQQDAEEQFLSRLILTGAEKKKRNNPRVILSKTIVCCLTLMCESEGGTLKLKSAVGEPIPEELETYLDGQRFPAVVKKTNVASVACVADNADAMKIT